MTIAARSHRSAWAVFVMFLLSGAGCSGGGAADSTPVISNLHVSRTEAYWNEGAGSILVEASFNFADAGGDLAVVHLTSSEGDRVDVEIAGGAGERSGTVMATLSVDTTNLGHYTFEVYATDGGNRRSNALSGTFDIVPDDTGSAWTVQTLPVPGDAISLHRVRWLDGMFLAAGSNLFTSPDGVTWTVGPAGPFEDAAWTGTHLVAAGYPSVAISSDGVTWSASTLPAANQAAVHGVAASGPRVVGVGVEMTLATWQPTTLIVTSTDGVTWTKVDRTFPGELRSVVWSGTQFVAVGVALGGSNAAGMVLTSPDGLGWTEQSVDATFLNDIAWNGSRFVAVGSPWAVTSTDGVTWQQTGVGVLASDDAIGWSGKRFMACGVVYCTTSTDGLQWQNDVQPGATIVSGVAWSGTRWVAVGTSGPNATIVTSP